MKYIVYLTTNLVNKKIYVGVHSTETPYQFDGYLGDGAIIQKPSSYKIRLTPLQCAIDKYGQKNFIRKTLRVFENLQDALDLEAWIVNREFIERTDTYNITLGGSVPPRLNKHIYQYSLEGILIKEWESIKSITDYFNVNKDRVRMVINDKRSFENSYWSEEKYEKLNISEYRPSSRGYIRQYTTDGVFLKSFKNTTEASKQLDIDRAKISNAIYGKYATSGFWFLKEGETIESYLDGSIKQEKPIYVYYKSGELFKKFNSFTALKKELKYNKGDIKRAIKNNSLFKDYYWSNSLFTNIVVENPNIIKCTPRKVYQYTLDGDFVREWESINECKKQYPSVLQVCLGKRLHCHKFKFSFDKLKIQSDTIRNNG